MVLATWSIIAPIPSKCGTNMSLCSLGIWLSFSSLRESSSAELTACLTPAAFAASARFLICWISLSTSSCSQTGKVGAVAP